MTTPRRRRPSAQASLEIPAPRPRAAPPFPWPIALPVVLRDLTPTPGGGYRLVGDTAAEVRITPGAIYLRVDGGPWRALSWADAYCTARPPEDEEPDAT